MAVLGGDEGEMILVIGGKSQGKRAFVLERYGVGAARMDGPSEVGRTTSGFMESPSGADRTAGGFMESPSGADRTAGGVMDSPSEVDCTADGFVDGALAPWEVFLEADRAWNLHLMIRRRLEAGGAAEALEKELPGQLFKARPERILLVDEIGCGIVPLDAFERTYREVTGRICCALAAEAREVWRVVAGIGMQIK